MVGREEDGEGVLFGREIRSDLHLRLVRVIHWFGAALGGGREVREGGLAYVRRGLWGVGFFDCR